MGYTIAICDDDKNMADKLTVSLKNEFMKAGRNDVIIDYYDTGVQLLEALKNKMYKAVLLDINMEPMDGFAVAEAIGNQDTGLRLYSLLRMKMLYMIHLIILRSILSESQDMRLMYRESLRS